MDNKRILVTSALPYANGAIHFGHLAGAYLPADMYARYQRLKGRDVLFVCGSDEHGVSILISARKEGVSPQDIIDRYHVLNMRAFDRIGMSFDNYSRTSLPVHHETAREWFVEFRDKGLLRQSIEKQLYDPEARMFLPDRFVIGTCPHCGYDRAYGDQCENCSKYYEQTELLKPKSLLSDAVPEIRDARHWHFPLGEYQERLEHYIEGHADEWKENVLQQVRSWLKSGLSDRPISRDMDWGIPVPGEEEAGKVIYVWFEAVLGYISSSKEWAERIGQPEKWKEYWCDEETRYVPFIGKDNIVFHCLMFPAMLMEKGGYVLPANVPANEFLNLEGKKFSKSTGWSIELNEFLDTYPADPLRYTLAMNMPETRDSDFFWKDFQARNNNELADILGNFVNRTVHFVHKHFDGVVPAADGLLPEDEAFLARFGEIAAQVSDCYERFRFRDAVTATMNLARAANKYFNDREPWKTIKSDRRHCANTMHCSLQALHALTVLIEPVLPFTAEKLRTLLNIDHASAGHWDAIVLHRLPAGHPVGERTILFEKIDDATMEKETAKLGVLSEGPEIVHPELKEQITIDDFMKIDLRIGNIIKAEAVPKSKKLLKLIVDIGFETRQLVAGIATTCVPEDLIGRQVVIVANLKPATLFGIESQGMILAASTEEEGPVLLAPVQAIREGAIVK
ncbi:MAG: methionine--tRNA ligase [Bacteroidetes bacterium]|nr:methionine--tRNA ligase [Bacteroidota bacterium]